jgi:hypothetical protein
VCNTLAVIDSVSCALLTMLNLQRLVDGAGFEDMFEFFEVLAQAGPCFIFKRTALHCILLRRQLDIRYAIIFLPEIPTTETVLAGLAVFAECAIRTIPAVAEEYRKSRIPRVDTFVASLTVLDGETVHAVRVVDVVVAAVVAVLAVRGIDAHVAVFVESGMVSEQRILTTKIGNARAGSHRTKF